MYIGLSSVSPQTESSILFKKTATSPEFSEFSKNLSIYEKGRITSTSTIDLALYKDIIPHMGIPWDLYQLVYERSSLVYNAVNNTADFGIQGGFDFDSSSDAKRRIMEWMDKVDFELILANIFKQLQIFGNAYLDISNLNFPKLLPAKTMFVAVEKGGDDDGKVIGYRQLLDGGIKTIEFTPEEIIHFRYNDCCNSFYGMSELKPVLGALTRYANWTEDLGHILHRFAAPYLHHKVGTDVAPASQTQLDDYISDVGARLPGEDWVTSGAVDIKVIQASQGMMQMDNLVKSLQDEIIAGLRIPEIFARGGVTSNKAVGDIEMQAFDRKVKALQKTVAISLEDYLFPKLTKGKVKMVWNEFSVEGELIRAQRLQYMVQSGIPLKTVLQMVGWGTWTDEVEAETEKMVDTQPQIQTFKKDEKQMETIAMQVVSLQKKSYREPVREMPDYVSDIKVQKDIFRNPKVSKNAN